ncbi:MAG: endonuclease III [Archaeoglobi archaeon]|nr:endonuclease III [Candidatus Mnemosynella bozhongmuii]
MSRALEILKRLRDKYGFRRTELKFENPFQLLVAAILSAQTTDSQVNRVLDKLFQRFSTPEEFSKAEIEELEKELSSVGLYRNKARFIKESSRIIAEEFGGEVPDSMDALLKLPGVGRKTANVILSNAFKKNEGIAVDTHVMRLARRLGLSEKKKREEIEKDLMKLYPRELWSDVSHLLIAHGRKICRARKPLCDECFISDLCPSSGGWKDELS